MNAKRQSTARSKGRVAQNNQAGHERAALTSPTGYMPPSIPLTRCRRASAEPVTMHTHAPPEQRTVTPLQKRLQVGMLGKFFGDKDHVPGNAAALVSVFGFVLIILALCLPQAAVSAKVLVVGAGLTSNALSFLFGRATRPPH